MQSHRPWLQNLLADSLGDGLEGSTAQTQEAALLSSLMAALLKCCDPEVAFAAHAPSFGWCKAQRHCLGLTQSPYKYRLQM